MVFPKLVVRDISRFSIKGYGFLGEIYRDREDGIRKKKTSGGK